MAAISVQHTQDLIPTCLSCSNNDTGRCKLTGKDMYEHRYTLPKFGGCGEKGLKHSLAPLPAPSDPKDFRGREAYSWR